MKSRFLLLAMLPLVLVCLPLAATASGLDTFRTRITITSQCVAQGPLFGPQSTYSGTRVVCMPNTTPFQAESINLGPNTQAKNNDDAKDDTKDKTASQDENQSGAAGSAPAPSAQRVLSPPLPSESGSASKVIYVVF